MNADQLARYIAAALYASVTCSATGEGTYYAPRVVEFFAGEKPTLLVPPGTYAERTAAVCAAYRYAAARLPDWQRSAKRWQQVDRSN